MNHEPVDFWCSQPLPFPQLFLHSCGMPSRSKYNLPVLVIFCKRPFPGQGKQRLAREIGIEYAFKTACLLLDCALEDALHWGGDVVLSPSDPTDKEWAQGLLSHDTRVVPQPDKNLGERLNFIDDFLRDKGYEQLVFIGTDAPCLTPQRYQQVLQKLAGFDFVLPMSDDGGVTMMAGREPWPDLARLPWSSAQLGRSLEACCESRGYSVSILDGGYDVDVKKDVQRLLSDLKHETRPARKKLLEWLRQILSEKSKTLSIKNAVRKG